MIYEKLITLCSVNGSTIIHCYYSLLGGHPSTLKLRTLELGFTLEIIPTPQHGFSTVETTPLKL